MSPPPIQNQIEGVFFESLWKHCRYWKTFEEHKRPILSTETDPRGRFCEIFRNFERFKTFESLDIIANVNSSIWSIEAHNFKWELKHMKHNFALDYQKTFENIPIKFKIADPQIRGSNRFHGNRQLWKIRNSWPNWEIIAGTVLSNLEPLDDLPKNEPL